jgi:hypothetical protein
MSRDFQRSAVYAWERKQFPNIYAGNMELAACVEMAHMMYGAWVSVEDGRGRRRGCARTSRRRPTISLPRVARSPEYLAHEIAHLIVERDDRGAPSHGGIFMGHYLTLLSKWYGYDRATLVKSAQEAGLRVLLPNRHEAAQA